MEIHLFHVPFSASNFDIFCRASNEVSPGCVLMDFCQQIPSLSASDCLTYCVSHHCEGSALPILHLSSAYGPSQRPFSGTSLAIKGSTCPSSRLKPGIESFCLQFLALSSLCGGSTPPSELWISNSSTRCLDGFLAPLRASNCVSEFLCIGSGAYVCAGT